MKTEKLQPIYNSIISFSIWFGTYNVIIGMIVHLGVVKTRVITEALQKTEQFLSVLAMDNVPHGVCVEFKSQQALKTRGFHKGKSIHCDQW